MSDQLPAPKAEPTSITDDLDSLDELGVKHLQGNGVEKNPEEAVRLFRTAADRGHAPAQHHLAYCHYYGNGINKDMDQALIWFKKAAERNYAPAQYVLATKALDDGRRMINDPKQAFSLLMKSAAQNLHEAQYQLALHHYKGVGTAKDSNLGRIWMREAAGQGHVKAQFYLAKAYLMGIDIEKDLPEGLQWLMLAAEQNYPAAQYELAISYLQGTWTTKDKEQAIIWLKKAAQHGHVEAQYDIARYSFEGRHIEKNLTEAVTWYTKAAEQNHRLAQNYLALLYYSGKGVEKDIAHAIKWYIRAAEQGHPGAQYSLANLYFNKGDLENFRAAFKWFTRAADQGHIEAICLLKGQKPSSTEIPSNYKEIAWDFLTWLKLIASPESFNKYSAKYALGQFYSEGEEGDEETFKQAFSWFLKAAEEGFAPAQYEVATFYYYGCYSIKENLQTAVLWFAQAAKQGHVLAQFELAWCYLYGQGIKANLNEAFVLFSKAAAQDDARSQHMLAKHFPDGFNLPTQDVQQAADKGKKAVAKKNNDAVPYSLEELFSQLKPADNKALKKAPSIPMVTQQNFPMLEGLKDAVAHMKSTVPKELLSKFKALENEMEELLEIYGMQSRKKLDAKKNSSAKAPSSISAADMNRIKELNTRRRELADEIAAMGKIVANQRRKEDFTRRVDALRENFSLPAIAELPCRLDQLRQIKGDVKKLEKELDNSEALSATEKPTAYDALEKALNSIEKYGRDCKNHGNLYLEITAIKTVFDEGFPKIMEDSNAAISIHNRLIVALRLSAASNNKAIKSLDTSVKDLQTQQTKLQLLGERISALHAAIMDLDAASLETRLSLYKDLHANINTLKKDGAEQLSAIRGAVLRGITLDELENEKMELRTQAVFAYQSPPVVIPKKKVAPKRITSSACSSAAITRTFSDLPVLALASPPEITLPIIAPNGVWNISIHRDSKLTAQLALTASAGLFSIKSQENKLAFRHAQKKQPQFPYQDVVDLAGRFDHLYMRSNMQKYPHIVALAQQGFILFFAQACLRTHIFSESTTSEVSLTRLRHELVHNRLLWNGKQPHEINQAYQAFMQALINPDNPTEPFDATFRKNFKIPISEIREDARYLAGKFLDFDTFGFDFALYNSTKSQFTKADRLLWECAQKFLISLRTYKEKLHADGIASSLVKDVQNQGNSSRHGRVGFLFLKKLIDELEPLMASTTEMELLFLRR